MKPNIVTKFIANLVITNCCYLWGGSGEPVLQTCIGKIIGMETSKVNAARVLEHIAKLLRQGKVMTDALFLDCSGLVLYGLTHFNLYYGDINADGLYSLGTPIPVSEAKEGDLVFHGTDTNKDHVGWIGANGIVYECKGRDDGATTSKITDSKWQYAAHYTWFENLTLTRKLKVKTNKPMSGEDVRNIQRALCSHGFPCKVAKDNKSAVYNENTRQAVERFQKAAKLSVLSYGVVAKKTAKALGFAYKA